jgi:hypothetical protein
MVEINKHPFTIIGVAPESFRGAELFFAPAFWIPLVDEPVVSGFNDLQYRGNHSPFILGRLKPGVTPAEATADLQSLAAWLAKTYPSDDEGVKFSLARPGLLGDMIGGPARAFLGGLMLLAGLILLAACANLGSLFAARAADRSKEVALRLALGSRRGRILRQLLTEALLVSLAGGVVGLAGSVVILHGLSVWQPISSVAHQVPVNPDLRTYLVALALSLGQRPALRPGSHPPSSARRSLADDSLGDERHAGDAPLHAARPAAGGADRHLRRAGHLLAGGRARPDALAAQQLRLPAGERRCWSKPICRCPATQRQTGARCSAACWTRRRRFPVSPPSATRIIGRSIWAAATPKFSRTM